MIDEANIAKVLTLLFPQSKKRNIKQSGLAASNSLFVTIFKENNSGLRIKFFRDPLAKHLWGKIFVEECAQLVKSHLRKIRSQPDQGEVKFMRLFKHMLQLEE